MTTRLSLFESPLFLGFDEFERTLERIHKSGSEGYPPYNIEQLSEDEIRISLAVAGFSMDDLSVEVEKNQLTIFGKQQDDSKDRVFLHRGIASRQFQRAFVLADGMEVKGASLDKGLLHINLMRVLPERSVQKIKIKDQGKSSKGKNIDAEDAIDINEV